MTGPVRPDRERGSATVLTLAVGCVALVAAMVLAGAAQAYAAGARAQGIADLAALAGAAHAVRGEPGCAAARVVADRNGAQLLDCEPAPGGFLRVRVRTTAAVVLLGGGRADAEARAGPVR